MVFPPLAASRLRPGRRRLAVRLILPWLGCATPAALAAFPLLTVERPDGRVLQGRPGDVDAHQLTLILTAAGGTAELPFTPAEVRRLSWEDDAEIAAARQASAAGDPAAAAAWSVLWLRRARLLPWADARAWEVGAAYLACLVSQGRHPEAAGLVRQLRPLATSWEDQRHLADVELVSVHALGLREEAALLATRWIAAEGLPHRSALGWRIGAEIALAAGQPTRARDLALAAVALGSLPPPPHLADCWDLATTALERLDEFEHAAAVRAEAAAWDAQPPGEPTSPPSHEPN